MTSNSSADIATFPTGSAHSDEGANHEADVIESNHHLPARTMAHGGDRRNQEDEPAEDAATTEASEELKHTTISDKVLPVFQSNQEPEGVKSEAEDKEMKEIIKDITPEADLTDAQDENMREQIYSPKKKRGRDQDEDSKDLERNGEASGSADGSGSNGSRSTRDGPEKKRPRDTSEEHRKAAGEKEIDAISTLSPKDTPPTTSAESETSRPNLDTSKKAVFGIGVNDQRQTSPTAFASSGFASLAAASTSGFGSIGASKPSIFGAKPGLSGFGALAAKPASDANKPATLGFGGASSSGFGGLGTTSAFGSALGNGFAGGSGPKLGSFAAPGKENAALPAKPAKAFGAPEVSDEDSSNEDDSDGPVGSGEEESGRTGSQEEKKKSKPVKVIVEDGESGEATLLQLRAKLFAIESKDAGWKERGVGTLKINVPKSCVTLDDNGVPISGSFDLSGSDDDEEGSEAPKIARLIMRQENTHRVILNTVIIKAMEFKDKASASTAQIMFTAFEGKPEPKPISMLLKMSEANSRLFHSEISSIQHEL
ncbi:hypothetical protein HYALB_00001198 [Hymenoscyphus albidus]|uniref:RanBD1 domain-containing protein n=1 Tax=Hymenoscyphus albidus TaxID=595503 RepID=A0A9N9LH48_9HELO|nr:hypothetical protein HYALB_00001198 [Hymenoscyphus albidus]